MLPDSVEEGDKIVNAAVDKFGRIGESRYIFGTKADNVVGRLTAYHAAFTHMYTYSHTHIQPL